MKVVHLREFSPSEIIFTDEEARLILKFFFVGKEDLIDTLQASHQLLSFSQALLLEAMEHSLSIGLIESLFRASANPTKSAQFIIKKFFKFARKKWLKAHKSSSLDSIQIYEIVRAELSRRFVHTLANYITHNYFISNDDAIVVVYPLSKPLSQLS